MNIDDKNKVIRRAFWSTELNYKQWKRKIGSASNSSFYLIDVFTHAPPEFIYPELGDIFNKRWPDIRPHMKGDLAQNRAGQLDARWAIRMTGDSQFPIIKEVTLLPKKRLKLHRLIVNNSSITTYEAAKQLGRDYSAVHADVQRLIKAGLIESREGLTSNNVIKKALFSTKSINTVLFDAEAAQ